MQLVKVALASRKFGNKVPRDREGEGTPTGAETKTSQKLALLFRQKSMQNREDLCEANDGISTGAKLQRRAV